MEIRTHHHTAPRRQHDHPKPLPPLHPLPARVPLATPDHLRAPQRQRPAHEHRQQLQAYHRQVRAAPPLVRLRVLLPQLAEGPAAIRRAEQRVVAAEEVDVRGRQDEEAAGGRGLGRGADGRRGAGGGRGGDGIRRDGLRRGGRDPVDEEAVPQEGALEDEVDQGVEEVPDEEDAGLGGAAAREDAERQRVRGSEDSDGAEER